MNSRSLSKGRKWVKNILRKKAEKFKKVIMLSLNVTRGFINTVLLAKLGICKSV